MTFMSAWPGWLGPGRSASAAELGDEGPQPGLGKAGFSRNRPGEFGAASWAAPVGDERDSLGEGLAACFAVIGAGSVGQPPVGGKGPGELDLPVGEIGPGRPVERDVEDRAGRQLSGPRCVLLPAEGVRAGLAPDRDADEAELAADDVPLPAVLGDSVPQQREHLGEGGTGTDDIGEGCRPGAAG